MARSDEKHPVLTGLVALAAVAVVVGVIVGVVAVIGIHLTNMGQGASDDGVDAGASLDLPWPSPTKSATNALITLRPAPSTDTTTPGSVASHAAHKSPSASPSTSSQINLTASAVTAAPMQQFTLSGTFPAGEGHILRVQRMTAGSAWQDFGIPDMDVQGGQFSTPVETGRTGKNSFRVKDVDTGKTSNVVVVTIH